MYMLPIRYKAFGSYTNLPNLNSCPNILQTQW